jgi:hypothetical protein
MGVKIVIEFSLSYGDGISIQKRRADISSALV